jgi:putative endonuclease
MCTYYVYILQSLKTNEYYIGQTKNLEERLRRHNNGWEKYTKTKLPLKFIYSETYKTRKESVNRERKLKSYKSGNALKKLLEISKE